MRKHTSLYLDVLRIFAAVAVFFSHITRDSLSGGNSVVRFLGQFGQEGVAIFFVISGVVIAFVASEKERDFRSYVVARLGRLWSVIVPALILTVVLDTAGRVIAPEMYARPEIHAWGWNLESVWNFLGPLFFLNQVAFATADPGTNGPFWSLCYEFWYYIIFGIAYYVRGIPRILLAIGAAAIAGPKILGLFPIWAFGLIIYLYLGRTSSARLRAGIWGASCVGLFSLMVLKYKIGTMLVHTVPSVGVGGEDIARWISHFAVGIACAVNIAVYERSGGAALFRRPGVERWIRFLAARSFSLYLYQAPCLFFFGAITYGMHSATLRLIAVVVMTLAAVLMLAELTERRKSRFVAIADRLVPATAYVLPDWQIDDVDGGGR